MTKDRKLPEMTGTFAEKALEFIAFKHSLGFKYESETKCLSRFCRFAVNYGVKTIEITKELAYEWCAPRHNESPKNRAHRVTCIRQFAIYLNSLNYPAFIMPEVKNINSSSFTPYIFTHDEITRLIQAVDLTKERAISKDMHLSLPVIFRLLYGCGMRVSEVCRLQRNDVDVENEILTVRDSKNGADRLIPLSASVHTALNNYANAVTWKNEEEFFFRAPNRTQISPMTIYQRYRNYLFEAGISHGGKGCGPRLHDLRHTFAVHTLQKWIEEGTDLYAKIPVLAAYMGHRHIQSTARYLRLTAEVYPELLQKIEDYSAHIIPEVSDETD